MQNQKNKEKEIKGLSTKDLCKKIVRFGGVVSPNITFVLEWFDANQLEMTMDCPCSKTISLKKRHCDGCNSKLDIDKNADGNTSLEPIETLTANGKGVYTINVNMLNNFQTYSRYKSVSFNFELSENFWIALQDYESNYNGIENQDE